LAEGQVWHHQQCEFHWLAFAPLFLLLAFYYANKSLRHLLLFAALALACREDVALTLFPLGVSIALYENRRGGVAVYALSAFWLLVAVGVVVPILSGGRASPHFAYWSAYGESPAQVVRFVLTHPLQTLHIVFIEHDGLKHIFKVSLFLLFLPLLAPEALLKQGAGRGVVSGGCLRIIQLRPISTARLESPYHSSPGRQVVSAGHRDERHETGDK